MTQWIGRMPPPPSPPRREMKARTEGAEARLNIQARRFQEKKAVLQRMLRLWQDRAEKAERVLELPPDQPIVQEGNIQRFKRNPIVAFLLDAGPFDMNQLALMPFNDEDRTQFAQLIGYSVSGFSELPYVSDDTWERVAKKAGLEEP